jgi:hypothetical protein
MSEPVPGEPMQLAPTQRLILNIINKSIAFAYKLAAEDEEAAPMLAHVAKLYRVTRSVPHMYILKYDETNWFPCESKHRCITPAHITASSLHVRQLGIYKGLPVYVFVLNGIPCTIFIQMNTFMNMLSVRERKLADILFSSFTIYYSNPEFPSDIDLFEEDIFRTLVINNTGPASGAKPATATAAKTLRWRNSLNNVREFYKHQTVRGEEPVEEQVQAQVQAQAQGLAPPFPVGGLRRKKRVRRTRRRREGKRKI